MAHELTPRTQARLGTSQPARMGLRMKADNFERLFEEHSERLYAFLGLPHR